MPTLTRPAKHAPRVLLPPRQSNWFWRNARKVVVAVTGFTLLLAGLSMLLLPGPGWVTIFGALALLATEFAWARWVLKEARHRLNGVLEAAKTSLATPPPTTQVDPQ